jgi:hypothetical protein
LVINLEIRSLHFGRDDASRQLFRGFRGWEKVEIAALAMTVFCCCFRRPRGTLVLRSPVRDEVSKKEGRTERHNGRKREKLWSWDVFVKNRVETSH